MGFGKTTDLLLSWLILVALTLLSYWFRDHGLNPASAIIAILIITFVKVYMVGYSFMEIRHAPKPLQLAFTIWCAGTCAVLIGLLFVF